MECPRCLQNNIRQKVPMTTREFKADVNCSGYVGHLPERIIDVDVGVYHPKYPKFEIVYCDLCKDCGTILHMYIKINGKFLSKKK